MRIKLDENLPGSLADVLRGLGHDVDTAAQEALGGREDDAVFQGAKANRRFLITQDLHFSDIHDYKPGQHPGILVLRLRNTGWVALLERVRLVFRTEHVEDWTGALVIATERKIRILRPSI